MELTARPKSISCGDQSIYLGELYLFWNRWHLLTAEALKLDKGINQAKRLDDSGVQGSRSQPVFGCSTDTSAIN